MKYLKLYQKSLRKVNSMNTNDIIKRLFEEGHISEEEKKNLLNNIQDIEHLKDFYIWKAWKNGELLTENQIF